MEEPKRQILVVDDHPVFRLGLKTVLDEEPSFTVVACVGTAAEALSKLRESHCDAALLDISLPGANGIELVKQIKAEHPDLAMLLVSMHDEAVYALRALRAGALGYVMKREGPDAVLTALRKVLAGQISVSPEMGERLIYRMAHGESSGAGTPIDNLTDRELEILALIGQGQSSHQIAKALHLSVKTVESHRLHIKVKLGLRSAPELVRFAMDWYEDQVAVNT